MHDQLFFDATIEISGIDRPRMLPDVSDVISDQLNINIHKLTITSDDGIFDGKIELKVHNRKQVIMIIEKLQMINNMQEVRQIL